MNHHVTTAAANQVLIIVDMIEMGSGQLFLNELDWAGPPETTNTGIVTTGLKLYRAKKWWEEAPVAFTQKEIFYPKAEVWEDLTGALIACHGLSEEEGHVPMPTSQEKPD